MSIEVKETKTEKADVVKGLRQVVADSYALLGQLHICHWNVTGPSFFSLHNAFEEQYTELFGAIDEVAERIRALGAKAPGGLRSLASMSEVKEASEDCDADDMVRHLRECHEILIGNLKEARNIAADASDDQTEDMMISRIQVHDKAAWMLRSYMG